MRARFAVPVALLILAGGWYISEEPSRLGPVFEFLDDQIQKPDLAAPVVQMQADERWLVVVVDFTNAPETGFRNVARANTILSGTSGADDYISQTTGGASTLTVTVQPEVYHASFPDTHWGADTGGIRDSGDAGTDGPAGLAASVIKNALVGVDLAPFDLNSDGWVDRFLILHTADAQEDAGGPNKIWSHFGPLMETVEVGDYKFDHYTITGFDSGLGTITHEMLHQMGALDLYDVHGQGTGEDWNGVGDWDVMASGNWNGVNGNSPALPTLATMDLIGVDRATEVAMSATTPQSQSYQLEPISDGGQGLVIQISPSEWVWMAYRGDIGFDSELPGNGLLVTVQDTSVGNPEQNLVNTQPDNAWLYVLEADGDGGLLDGSDEGESGDVFVVGGKFGAEGRIIYDHHGRKVHWTAEVTAVGSGSLTLNLTSAGAPTFTVLPPHGPIQLLPSESISLVWSSSIGCTPEVDLFSSDGRTVTGLSDVTLMTAGESSTRQILWDSGGSAGTAGRLIGNASCGSGAAVSLDINFFIIGQRLISETYNADVQYEGSSFVEVPLEFEGFGSRLYDVRVEGPLERIASTAGSQTLSDGSVVNLSIEPNGLLVPGMLAAGQIILRDQDGLEQSMTVVLTAEQFEQGGEIIRFFSDPSNIIMVMAGLLALSVLLGISGKKKGSPASRIREAARRKVNVERKKQVKDVKYSPVGGPSRPSGPSGEYTDSGVIPSNLKDGVSHEERVEMRPMGLKPSGEAPPAGDKPASQMRQASLDPTVGVQPGGQPSGEALASQQPSQEKKAGFSDPNEIPDLDDQ
jgi:M6 family metalloprotease-like protein